MNFQTAQQDENLNQFIKACEYHEAGQYQEAEALYHHLLTHVGENWLLHYNLGLLLFETGRAPEALTHYMRATSLENSNSDLFFNLALCQKQCGHYKTAVISYQRALELNPGDPECFYNLGNCYIALDEPEEAIRWYEAVLEIAPCHQSALNNIAFCYHRVGRVEQAIVFYKRLLKVHPEHASADHMLAALTGQLRASAPLSYVEEVFDNYSANYEFSLLHNLQYTLPQHFLAIITGSSGKSRFNRVLDIGCGTGLLGEALRGSTAHLHGMDLSSNMIAIADQKKLYDRLITGDIHTVYPELEKESYDLLVAADVFAYIGDLVPVFTITETIGTAQCHFYFSVEMDSDTGGKPVLRESGRFAHSQSYVKRTAQKTGWQIVDCQQVNLRKERGNWIKGAVYGMKKIN